MHRFFTFPDEEWQGVQKYSTLVVHALSFLPWACLNFWHVNMAMHENID